ncbi:hypothetical protein [Dictyobacter formicarum]|uniref:NAD-dependent epimerase/dehydratase domain-containing protein n=1 Tax=Dictyobacter formicarum TaxID=2778368 RepID=A0ABQ3VVT7_9CHLR|nr:hypothetical protein [Dictyobacter formicarum]GHO89678.1 hypothetical protein KSZ_76840 [Dictyobacter formicarum]
MDRYRNQRILLLGSSGYLGRTLYQQLQQAGQFVVPTHNTSSCSKLASLLCPLIELEPPRQAFSITISGLMMSRHWWINLA